MATTTVKLKLRQILNPEFDKAIGALSNLSGIPRKTAFRLAKLLTKLAPDVELFNKEREKLVKEFGDEVADQPGQFQIPVEKQAKFNTEIETLLDVEIEVTSWLPLTLADFGDVQDGITARQFQMLMPFMADEDEDAADSDAIAA